MADISKLKVNENIYDIKDSVARTNIETLENSLSTVATTGNYNDLSNKPTIPDVSNFITKDVNNLTYYTKTSDLSTVATTGNYNDLSNKPTIPDVSNFITKDVNDLTYYTLTSNLSSVATSGNYNDLSNKPTIPDVSNFITKDVNNLTYYTLTSNLSTVATSGSYNDLSNKPTIPTKTSDLTNDSNFATTSYVDNAVKDVYSTTEQLIGTFKGSNLYRRVIDIPSTSISSGSTTVKSLLNENINIVNYSGTIIFATSNYTYSINGFRNLDYGLRYDRTNHGLQLIVGTSLAPEGSFSGELIIEYTKN